MKPLFKPNLVESKSRHYRTIRALEFHGTISTPKYSRTKTSEIQ